MIVFSLESNISLFLQNAMNEMYGSLHDLCGSEEFLVGDFWTVTFFHRSCLQGFAEEPNGANLLLSAGPGFYYSVVYTELSSA